MEEKKIVKRIDDLGRIVIPKVIRTAVGVSLGDELSVEVEGESIVLKRVCQSCCLCGVAEGLTPFKDKYVCADCVKEIAKVK